MSKIQINELNRNAFEFNTLSQAETAEVVGGYWYYPSYSYSYYSYSDNDFAAVQQGNFNGTEQVSFGGVFGNTGNSNGTGQGNTAIIYQ